MARNAINLVRVVAETGERVRSSERQTLAAAILRRNAASDRLARIRAAIDDASYFETSHAVDRAEQALAEAQQNEPARIVAATLGDPAPEGPSVEQARKRLADAQAVQDRASRTRDAFREQERDAERELSYAQTAVRNAMDAVIATDPAIDRLIASYREKRRALEALRLTIEALAKYFAYDRRGWSSVEVRDLQPDLAWVSAVTALTTDADAELPE
jgi:hypothetical protein